MFSRNQRFVGIVYGLLVTLAILLTLVFAAAVWPLVYYVWFVCIGLAGYVSGHFASRLFGRFGLFLFVVGTLGMGAGTALLLATGVPPYEEAWNRVGEQVYRMGKWAALVLISGGHVVLGLYLQRKQAGV